MLSFCQEIKRYEFTDTNHFYACQHKEKRGRTETARGYSRMGATLPYSCAIFFPFFSFFFEGGAWGFLSSLFFFTLCQFTFFSRKGGCIRESFPTALSMQYIWHCKCSGKYWSLFHVIFHLNYNYTLMHLHLPAGKKESK